MHRAHVPFFLGQRVNKQELITYLNDERAKLEAVLARVKPEQMTQPGVCGHWSVKDLVAHLAVWTSREVTVLFQAERGQKISYGVLDDGKNDWANVNEKDYEQQKNRPLERIFEDFRGAHKQLIKRLTTWQDETALFQGNKFAGSNNSLAEKMVGGVGEHDAEHRAQIEAWLKNHL
jgi:uncharacterized protein (TIGR03083 family)